MSLLTQSISGHHLLKFLIFIHAVLQKYTDLNHCPSSCYLNGGRIKYHAGHSALGVLIYRLKKKKVPDINYLKSIVSVCVP